MQNMTCDFCHRKRDCISFAQIKELNSTKNICISCLLIEYAFAKGITFPPEEESNTKKCAACNTELLVSWEYDGEGPELCDECFYIQMRKEND